MKRNIWLSIFVAVNFVCTSFAQTTTANEDRHANSRDAKRKLVLGFKAGWNHSNVYDESSQNFVADSKTGGIGGVFLAIPLGGFLGFQPEMHLSQKGFEGAGSVGVFPYRVTRTTTHLDFPLQAQLKFFSFFSLLGGVQYSYLLKQKDVFTNGAEYVEVNQAFENDNIRRNLFGLVGGFDLNLWHIVFSGRAGWDMTSNHGDGSSSTPQYKNTWLQGTIGYRIY